MKILVLFIIAVIMLAGCSYQPGEVNFNEIEHLPESYRLARFSSFPVDEQVNIFHFSQINLRGKSDTYMRYLAEDGQSKIEAIVLRISREQRFSFKTDLLTVIDLIDLKCNCVGSSRVLDALTLADEPVNADDPTDVRETMQLYEKILRRIKDRYQHGEGEAFASPHFGGR